MSFGDFLDFGWNQQPTIYFIFFLHIEHYWLSALQRLCIRSLVSGYSFYILDEYLMLLCPFYTWKSHVGFLLKLWFSDYEDLNPIPSMLFEPSFSWSPSCHHHHRHYWPQPNICLHLTVFFASSSLTPANFTPSFAPSINLHLPANRSLSRRLPAVVMLIVEFLHQIIPLKMETRVQLWLYASVCLCCQAFLSLFDLYPTLCGPLAAKNSISGCKL